MAGVDEPGVPTLYEWAGGADPLRRMIDCFYDRVEADDALAGFFPGGVSEHHRAHVADWWAEVLGGPATYTEHHGGYESMLRHHLGLAITPAQRHRFAATMSLAADDAGAARRPGVPGRDHRLPRVGHPPGDGELPARRRAPGAGTDPALGLGRRAALPGLSARLRIRIR